MKFPLKAEDHKDWMSNEHAMAVCLDKEDYESLVKCKEDLKDLCEDMMSKLGDIDNDDFEYFAERLRGNTRMSLLPKYKHTEARMTPSTQGEWYPVEVADREIARLKEENRKFKKEIDSCTRHSKPPLINSGICWYNK